jgi:hypothetical protein
MADDRLKDQVVQLLLFDNLRLILLGYWIKARMGLVKMQGMCLVRHYSHSLWIELI